MNVIVKTNKVMFEVYHEDHESHVVHDFQESHVVNVDHVSHVDRHTDKHLDF